MSPDRWSGCAALLCIYPMIFRRLVFQCLVRDKLVYSAFAMELHLPFALRHWIYELYIYIYTYILYIYYIYIYISLADTTAVPGVRWRPASWANASAGGQEQTIWSGHAMMTSELCDVMRIIIRSPTPIDSWQCWLIQMWIFVIFHKSKI